MSIPIMKSIPEAAQMFGISQHFCRTLALSGRIKAIRVGGVRSKILINVQSMIEYFNESALHGDEEACSALCPISVKIGRNAV